MTKTIGVKGHYRRVRGRRVYISPHKRTIGSRGKKRTREMCDYCNKHPITTNYGACTECAQYHRDNPIA